MILFTKWTEFNIFGQLKIPKIPTGLARRGSTIGSHLFWHTVELPWELVFCLL